MRKETSRQSGLEGLMGPKKKPPDEDVHLCHARPYCTIEVPRNRYACLEHWLMLPKDMRDAIWKGWNEDRLGVGHLEAMKEATVWLHSKLRPKEKDAPKDT